MRLVAIHSSPDPQHISTTRLLLNPIIERTKGIYLPRTSEITGISESVIRSRMLAPVGLAVFTLALLALCMDRWVNAYDEGIILEGAERLLAGALPHRDFCAIYGPAQFAAVAAIFKLVGPSIIAARIWTW
jgi:hypothetical protein